MSEEELAKIKCVPDPVMGKDDHYLSFDEAYLLEITEKGRPSLESQTRKENSYHPYRSHLVYNSWPSTSRRVLLLFLFCLYMYNVN